MENERLSHVERVEWKTALTYGRYQGVLVADGGGGGGGIAVRFELAGGDFLDPMAIGIGPDDDVAGAFLVVDDEADHVVAEEEDIALLGNAPGDEVPAFSLGEYSEGVGVMDVNGIAPDDGLVCIPYKTTRSLGDQKNV